MNFSVLEALFASRSNYTIVDAVPRRETGYAEIGASASPVYASEVH
jgi:UDP-3-O-[3-hydroxymyristoyl] N-acetylglucosamine deacetylase